MKVVVTGGAGYVGWSVINSLLDCREIDEVVVYDNFSRQNYGLLLTQKRPEYRWLRITVDDILNSRGLSKALIGADCVVHLAALAPSPFSDEYPHAFDQINHWGTAEVCYAVEKENIQRFVYVSSGAVYGFGESSFQVNDEPIPATAYGASKLAGERHAERLADSRDSIILRAGTVYGINPVARFDTFVNKFALDVSLARPLQVHGSGEQHRPIIHVDGLADVVAAAGLGELQSGAYNVVDENISVTSAISYFKGHSPESDIIYISQGQRLRDLIVEPDGTIKALGKGQHWLADEIETMLNRISIG